ncbi:hypothetical protein ASG25_21175 [Rhizobium sp. Leaf384]|uniref:hypothetical protein n=1 Tax=unclassified Rhizobium TaxID=2613769 RepID=UPI000715D606|nr:MULTISPECIES: hypothetical protein [unclassified Rhizobium]KQS74311.1 hypothetical protein ASG25_21175 [Rhizobium sp. Leaf384]KQS83954.1 hypothetical protein ASG58_21555 [Rhizobium sp. Leaf383]
MTLNLQDKHGFISRKRVSAAFGEDVEDIDEEKAVDQARAQRLGLQYPVYPALASLDFTAILAASLTADEIEDITSEGESSDAGSIMSAS